MTHRGPGEEPSSPRAEFTALWGLHEVAVRRASRMRVLHPLIGPVDLDCQVLLAPEGDGQHAVVRGRSRRRSHPTPPSAWTGGRYPRSSAVASSEASASRATTLPSCSRTPGSAMSPSVPII
ncbi:MmyB family transcriptional regulator [Streptomyces sp. NBC_00503]|uniref:MmyB family transcriptional regulator n=1 Tax=Streptomyces sp. NBC_00503 TaxID=2903659 RepID=UPI002E81E3A8|nr:hypothetical protein [Streptomyces sp. NBC_00503]WUD82588.1 hypothetical protein OG490_19710 [Streptomyces sp. NBC_00503]